MKRIALLTCALTLYSVPGLANKCDWATSTPTNDSKYKYLVAKSYSDVSASDAAYKAERDIDNQIGRLFGTALNVQSDFYADETTSAGTTRSYERTIGTISLKGLERQKNDVDKESGGWVGCVQYRYSQKEFEREKQRLAKMPESALANIVFNESVGDTTCKGAPVEILTTPAKAFVTIDNGKYQGMSPIKFGNVCNGKHSIEITKENYEYVSENLIVPTTGKINKTLKRGTKAIKIRTSLGNSRIFINDVDYGKEPVKFNAPLGIEQTITAKNAEAVNITRTLAFSKYSEPEYLFNMEKLPGKIDFSAFKVRNPDVKISVNGKIIKSDSTGELSSDDTHKIVFSKDGFFDINKTISINGGETTYYPSKALEFSKDPDRTVGMLVALGGSYGSNNAGANLSFEWDLNNKWFYGAFGLELNFISVSSAKVHFDNEHPRPLHMTNKNDPVDIKMEYLEFLHSNIGVNLNKNISLFGIGALGVLSVDPEYKQPKSHTIVRYGVGLQYKDTITLKEFKEWGIRFSYLTGGVNLSPSEFKHSRDSNPNVTDIPKQINSFNLSVFLRGIL